MKIYLIGLGKMGYNFALNLSEHNHQVVAYDLVLKDNVELAKAGIKIKPALDKLLEDDQNKRVIWLLIPNHHVKTTIEALMPYLRKGDIVVDGGNSNYHDSVTHSQILSSVGVSFLDVGTSGGTHGARYGANLMIGGDHDAYIVLEDVFKDVSLPNGFLYVGKSGAGHFTKMVHNGIEYAMMQSIAEGLNFMAHSPYEIDYEKVLDLWNHGSIIESKLVEYTKEAFVRHGDLKGLLPRIDDSGEGKWMIEDALNFEVSIPLITQSLFTRYQSRDENKFLERIIAGMRESFGGHKVYKK